MAKKRVYKQNRQKAAKTIEDRWEVYRRWYRHYAKNNEMADAELDLKSYKATIARAKALGLDTKNISKRTAMQQRKASELQLRVTWEQIKKQIPEFKKDVELTREQIKKQKLAEFVTGKKNLSTDQIDAAIKKWGEKAIPESVDRSIEEDIRSKMADEINYLENYEDIKFGKFRKEQSSVVNKAREIVLKKYGKEEGRQIWDESFKEAVDFVYRE